MSHTPGPWQMAYFCADGKVITRDDTYEIRTPNYDVATIVPGGGPIRNKADAALIAAAPELLAACEALLECWRNPSPFTDGSRGQQRAYAFDLADAAIAKAKGQADD